MKVMISPQRRKDNAEKRRENLGETRRKLCVSAVKISLSKYRIEELRSESIF